MVGYLVVLERIPVLYRVFGTHVNYAAWLLRCARCMPGTVIMVSRTLFKLFDSNVNPAIARVPADSGGIYGGSQ